jgi:hypothetical protein
MPALPYLQILKSPCPYINVSERSVMYEGIGSFQGSNQKSTINSNHLFNTKSIQNIETIKINNIVIEKIAFISTLDVIWYQIGANL